MAKKKVISKNIKFTKRLITEDSSYSILLKTNRKLLQYYDDTANQLARILNNKTLKYKSALWKWNPRVEKDINEILELLRNNIKQNISEASVSSWNEANTKYNVLVKDYTKGLTIPVTLKDSWNQSNISAMKAFLNRSINGLKLSGRVWNMTLKNKKLIELVLSSGITDGKSATQLSRIFRQALKEPDNLFRRIRDPQTKVLKLSNPAKNFHPGRGVYRSSYKNALRLARNEINLSYRYAEFERRQRIPFIVGVYVKLSHSHPEYDICDSMAGKYPKDFVFMGWHPNCICYSTNILLSKDKFKDYLKTGRISKTNYIQNINKGSTDYIKNNTNNIRKFKNTPYFIKENFNFVDGSYKYKR